jgi:hypothetical protein
LTKLGYRPGRHDDIAVGEDYSGVSKKDRVTGYYLGTLKAARDLFTTNTGLTINWG